MKKSFRVKKSVFFVATFLLLMALTVWFAVFAVHGAGTDVDGISRADGEETTDSYALDVASWTPFTYLNASEFFIGNISISGRDYATIGYTLPTTADKQYSMEATLTSGETFVPQNTYVFRFSYYTRMRAETPHQVTLLASTDGETFVPVGSVSCPATGEEFKKAEIALSSTFSFLKLEIKTFYSYNDDDTIDRGIYFLASSFALVAPKHEVFPQSDFRISYSADSFVYNGQPQMPEAELESTLHAAGSYAYDLESCLPDGTPAPSVDAGRYLLRVSVRNRSNCVCFVAEKEYEILPARVSVNKIDYVSNNHYTVLLDADVTDESGRSLTAEELGLEYFTSTVNGRRVQSASPVLDTPNENFSVGITVSSANFVEPTENTFVSVHASYGEEAVFKIAKRLEYVYTGEVVDVTKDAFFTTDPNVAVAPSVAPSIAYFDLNDDGKAVSEIRRRGEYRCHLTYKDTEYDVFVTVTPRPVSAFLYSGGDLIKYYDGTTALYDANADAIVLKPDLNCIDDPDLPGEDGFLLTGDNDVRLQYKKASFARTIGNGYIVLEDPSLGGVDADNYYIAPSFHVVSAVSLGDSVYEKQGEAFIKTTDAYFREGKTYYDSVFTRQTVTAGATIEGTFYEKNNTTYVKTTDTTFLEKDYYTFSGRIVENSVLSILPTQLILKSDRDSVGNVITCPDKVYTPDDYVAEKVESDVTLPSYGLEDDLPYSAFSFVFDDCSVGTHALNVLLTDETYYDRFLPEVITPVPILGTVVPKVIDVDASQADGFVSGRTKEYDGNRTARPVFSDFILTETPVGFPGFDEYVLTYASATYAQSDVGSDIAVTIEGIALNGLTIAAQEYLKNYSVSTLTITGEITPRTLEIYSKTLRIYEKQTPVVSSNAESDADLQKRIYADTASADAGGDPIPFTMTVAGDYVLRIDCVSPNYRLPGTYVLLPLTVTSGEKMRQKIVFSDIDTSSGTEFYVLTGSNLSILATSVEESTGLATGLPVSYRLNDEDGVFNTESETWRATKSGQVTLTVSQAGNRYYYEADSIVLTLTVIDEVVTGSATVTGLYGGKNLPVLTPDQYQLTYKDTAPKGTLIPSDDVLVAGDEARGYTYYFTADPYLTGSEKDFSVNGDYYIRNGKTYEKVSGAFGVFEEYYLPSYVEQAVTAGEAVPGASYYEYVYKATLDQTFLPGKSYYRAEYAADDTVPVGGVVPTGIYYEKEDGVFYVTSGTFHSGRNYYTHSYVAASVTAGEIVDGEYYEQSGEEYVLTEDTVFADGKTYYLSSYVSASVIYGTAIPTEPAYYERSEDIYTFTEDTVFTDGKTYYRTQYVLADVEEGTARTGIYYEPDKTVYRLTYDNVFVAGKKYFTVRYDRVYFISAGDRIDVELYRERGEGNTLLTLTEGDLFEPGHSYVYSVWTKDDVTAGDAVPADTYYEKSPVTYRKTEDEAFLAGKTYFITLFTPVPFDSAKTLYERVSGTYIVTPDVSETTGKTYYELSYVEAVVPGGGLLNGKTYYEQVEDAYFITSDSVFDGEKEYYVRSFVDVTFLVNGSLPDDDYYRTVPTYRLTSDTTFERNVVYYTVFYEEAVVVAGTHIAGEYYVFDSEHSAYVLASERYFAYDSTYYSAVFTAQDKLKERKIDSDNAYYFKAEGTYETDVNYYVFDVDRMRADDVTAGEGADGDHYVLVTDEEFLQGRTYYYLAYPFLGQTAVSITLAAQKPLITVYTASENSSLYGEDVDLCQLVEKVTLNDGAERIIPVETWQRFIDRFLTFSLMTGSPEGVEPVDEADLRALLPGVYTFENNRRESYSEEVTFLEMTVNGSDQYEFRLADGTTTHTVYKNVISVSLPLQNKFYGESVKSANDMMGSLVYLGCGAAEKAAIRAALDVSLQAYSYSDIGEYPIHLMFKNLLSVGSPIPANTYYERTEEGYELTLDTVFAEDKTYYRTVFREAEVTVGDTIDPSAYYILNVGNYIHPFETEFAEGTTYYVIDYEEANIYHGLTIDDLSVKYDIKLLHGYLKILPISVSVGARSEGHDYGSNPTRITTYITVLSDAALTEEEMNDVHEEILVDTVTYCDVSASSDSGNYPIAITYNGSDKNIYVTVERNCFYPVHFAKLNADPDAPSFTFNDASVLYDGNLHTITVSYNTRLWEDVTITYDKGSFSTIGNYLYTATVSKKNYEDLVLTATMSIGTLTVRSSNQVTNSATVVITDPTCYSGVNGDYTILLRSVTDEDLVQDVTNMVDEAEENDFTVKGVYSLLSYLDSSEATLGYSSYTVTVSPSDLKYAENLQIFAYSGGVFKKVDYTYRNGAYTFSVSSNVDENSALDPLSYFAFVEVKEKTVAGVQYKWVFIAIIGVVVLMAIGIVIAALAGAGKSNGRSRRRHRRWV